MSGVAGVLRQKLAALPQMLVVDVLECPTSSASSHITGHDSPAFPLKGRTKGHRHDDMKPHRIETELKRQVG